MTVAHLVNWLDATTISEGAVTLWGVRFHDDLGFPEMMMNLPSAVDISPISRWEKSKCVTLSEVSNDVDATVFFYGPDLGQVVVQPLEVCLTESESEACLVAMRRASVRLDEVGLKNEAAIDFRTLIPTLVIRFRGYPAST